MEHISAIAGAQSSIYGMIDALHTSVSSILRHPTSNTSSLLSMCLRHTQLHRLVMNKSGQQTLNTLPDRLPVEQFLRPDSPASRVISPLLPAERCHLVALLDRVALQAVVVDVSLLLHLVRDLPAHVAPIKVPSLGEVVAQIVPSCFAP